jgi:hypothetical protein
MRRLLRGRLPAPDLFEVNVRSLAAGRLGNYAGDGITGQAERREDEPFLPFE